MHKIQSIKFLPVVIPLTKPITTNLHTIKNITCVALLIYTEASLVGHSLIDGFGKTRIQDILHHLKKIISLHFKKIMIFIPMISGPKSGILVQTLTLTLHGDMLWPH
jgi:L-alanine-DL-glutamate epimerase-like enolase superfamily enzyme